jgi:hypothetical protein
VCAKFVVLSYYSENLIMVLLLPTLEWVRGYYESNQIGSEGFCDDFLTFIVRAQINKLLDAPAIFIELIYYLQQFNLTRLIASN